MKQAYSIRCGNRVLSIVESTLDVQCSIASELALAQFLTFYFTLSFAGASGKGRCKVLVASMPNAKREPGSCRHHFNQMNIRQRITRLVGQTQTG
jgi:hypothetical protein